MTEKNGIFFLTYDGYYNFTSGIGTQTNTFLRGIGAYRVSDQNELGHFETNLIVPKYDNTVYGYNGDNKSIADTLLSSLGGRVFTCESSLDRENSDFWTVKNWEKMCTSSAAIIMKEAEKYDNTIVLAVDPPFILTPKYITQKNTKNLSIKSVILMYTSTYIHDESVVPERLVWEKRGLASAAEDKHIRLADVCTYMTDHFMRFYNIGIESFIPYPSSLCLSDSDFAQKTQEDIYLILDKYRIPRDKDIIFAFGRASWVKGFDTLLQGFVLTECDAHLVLLASEFIENRVGEYLATISNNDIACTILTEFTRELPAALSQYEKCKIVVCPSRREPFSNIPLEVSLWAKENGPVVLASDVGGFKEQITDGENGFLFKVDNPKDLSNKISTILGLSDCKRARIRRLAHKKVLTERDFQKNFAMLIRALRG